MLLAIAIIVTALVILQLAAGLGTRASFCFRLSLAFLFPLFLILTLVSLILSSLRASASLAVT